MALAFVVNSTSVSITLHNILTTCIVVFRQQRQRQRKKKRNRINARIDRRYVYCIYTKITTFNGTQIDGMAHC